MAARGEQKRLPRRGPGLEERLARAEKTATALLEVARALGTTLDLRELLPLILGKVRSLLEATQAQLYLFDEARALLVPRLVSAEGDPALPRVDVPLGVGLTGLAAQGRAVRIADVGREARYRPDLEGLAGPRKLRRPRSLLAVPIVSHEQALLGVVVVLDKVRAPGAKGVGGFSVHDEELLSALAPQVAVAIDQASLFAFARTQNELLRETKEQLEHRVSDLKLLFDLETSMSRAKTFQELASAVTQAAAPACAATRAGLLVDEQEAGVWLYSIPFDGDRSGEVTRIRCQRGEGLLGRVMVEGRAVSYPSRGEGELPVSQRLTELLRFRVETAIAAPLEGGDGRALGAIAFYNSKRPRGFTEEDRSLLRLVSANVATAVQLARERFEHERGERLSSIGRLLSSVLHDLRTPLTVISGYAQLMARSDDRAAREQHLQVVLRQFDLLGSMQREVLEFARGERSSLIRKVSLVTFVQGIEQQLREEFRGAKVELSVDLLERGFARFDETKLTRALHNLARNALEAIGERSGFVRVRVERAPDGAILFSVEDSGGGVPEAQRAQLFQAFATSGKPGGTGLGLAVVKKIVDDHGGSIELIPTPLGSRFVLRLPQGDAAPPSRVSMAPPRPAPITERTPRAASTAKPKPTRRRSEPRSEAVAPPTVRAGTPSR